MRANNRSPRRMKEAVIRYICLGCALISVATTFGIIWTLLSEGLHFFKKVPFFDFLTGTNWSPQIEPLAYGVLPLVSGTAMIAIGSGVIAIPLGLMAAIFLSEYANHRVRSILKPLLEILAGIPTVVYGYFALTVVTPWLRSLLGQERVEVFNGASGCIVVGIMVLPLVCSLCEDALSAVPSTLREGAYGLGSTKVEVIRKIVVPSALSGIMAAFILAISRAVGETMAVTLASGNKPSMSMNPLEGIQTMTAYIVQITRGDTPSGTTAYYTLYAVGLTLFAFTFGMNMVARKLVKKFRQVYQ
jgi:phosphate transport system permease protein